jgi:hypothetical protein
MSVYMGSRITAPFILNLNTRWRCVINFTSRPLYLERKPIVTVEIGCWVGLRDGLDVSERRKIPFTCRKTSFATFHRICLKMSNKSFERWQSLNTLEEQQQVKMAFMEKLGTIKFGEGMVQFGLESCLPITMQKCKE